MIIHYIEIILSHLWVVNICHHFTIFRGPIVCKYLSVLIVVMFSYNMLKCFAGHHSQFRSGRVRPRTFRNTEIYLFREGVKFFLLLVGALCICKGSEGGGSLEF